MLSPCLKHFSFVYILPEFGGIIIAGVKFKYINDTLAYTNTQKFNNNVLCLKRINMNRNNYDHLPSFNTRSAYTIQWYLIITTTFNLNTISIDEYNVDKINKQTNKRELLWRFTKYNYYNISLILKSCFINAIVEIFKKLQEGRVVMGRKCFIFGTSLPLRTMFFFIRAFCLSSHRR